MPTPDSANLNEEPSLKFELHEGADALTALRDARVTEDLLPQSPYLTKAWLGTWAESYAPGKAVYAALSTGSGDLVAHALLQRIRGGLAAAADAHSGDWDVMAANMAVRQRLWEEIASLGARRLVLNGLRSGSAEAAVAGAVLHARGYGQLVAVTELASPYVALPASFDELLAVRSNKLRKQLRRARRSLERSGALRFRTTIAGPDLERDLERFLRLEASGWKARERTAILSDERTERLYRRFTAEGSEGGWLRLYSLELDGEVVASDLGCVLGGVGFLVKTAFDEQRAGYSPGLVLRGEALRASIDEGLRGYDFLGPPDRYKMRWTDEVRPRQRVVAYRGPIGRQAERVWEAGARRVLVPVRKRILEDPELRAGIIRKLRVVRRVGVRARVKDPAAPARERDE